MVTKNTSNLEAVDDIARALLYVGAAYVGWKLYDKVKQAADYVADITPGIPVVVKDSYEGWKGALTEEPWQRELKPGQCNVVDGVRACRSFDGTLTTTTDIKPWWEE